MEDMDLVLRPQRQSLEVIRRASNNPLSGAIGAGCGLWAVGQCFARVYEFWLQSTLDVVWWAAVTVARPQRLGKGVGQASDAAARLW
jgi:hypothetical protein